MYVLTLVVGRLLVEQAKSVLVMKRARENLQTKLTKHKQEVSQ